MTVRRKIVSGLVLVVLALSICLVYTPEHWLRRVPTFAKVTLDDHPVIADAYLGHPTRNEADAFLLIAIPRGGNYIFSLEGEKFRQMARSEFLRVPGGVFTYRGVGEGQWLAAPTPSLNEFRVVAPDGHRVGVKF